MFVSTRDLQDDFFAFIEQNPFPCVGAKSALANHTIETFQARDIRSSWDDLAIHRQLSAFGGRVKAARDGVFRSFAVLFEANARLTERDFEAALWERLQSLHDKDRWLSFRHDERVASDPTSPDFGFSIGGEAYFVVGMHPASSRLSRRTPTPTLVFNPVSQFQRLRDEGKYDRLSSVIRIRDEAMSGSANPMLAHHGDASAARQFSGRVMEDDWICPMRAAPLDTSNDRLLA